MWQWRRRPLNNRVSLRGLLNRNSRRKVVEVPVKLLMLLRRLLLCGPVERGNRERVLLRRLLVLLLLLLLLLSWLLVIVIWLEVLLMCRSRICLLLVRQSRICLLLSIGVPSIAWNRNNIDSGGATVSFLSNRGSLERCSLVSSRALPIRHIFLWLL